MPRYMKAKLPSIVAGRVALGASVARSRLGGPPTVKRGTAITFKPQHALL
jgi:hypothetical protein